MKRYCTSCGGPTEYSIKKPIFCSNCGKSFEPTTKQAVEKVQIKNPIIANKIDIQDFDEVDDVNNDDIRTVPVISNIEIEADNEKPNRGIKLKDLMGTDTNHTKTERVKSKSKKISKKQILEDFQKEAGSIRKKGK